MIDVPPPELQAAVERQHHCKARLVQSAPVAETDNGATVWEGVVQVFDLEGHGHQGLCLVIPNRGN